MDTTKTENQVPSPVAGDDGGAMAGREFSPSIHTFSESIESAHTQPVKPDDAGWYVAMVRCNCEVRISKMMASDFRSRGQWFESWVPLQRVAYIDRRCNKRKFREKVLLSTFIFCHVGREHLNDIRFRPDVYKMLTMPGHSTCYRIRDKELDDFRRLVDNICTPVTPCAGPLKKGQKVRVIEGPMVGMEAYVQRLSGKKAVIGNEIKYISGATIEIDRSLIEIITD